MSRVGFLLALLATSCGSEQPSPSVAADPDTGAVVEDAAPAEVCGNKLGDIFCDHQLNGYVRVGPTTGLATTETYGLHKLSEALSKSTVEYVYVFASAYW